MVTPVEYIAAAVAVPILICGTNHVIHSGGRLRDTYWRWKYQTAELSQRIDPDSFGDLATIIHRQLKRHTKCGEFRDDKPKYNHLGRENLLHTAVIQVQSRGAIRLRNVPAQDCWHYLGKHVWIRSGQAAGSEKLGITGFTLYYEKPRHFQTLEEELQKRRRKRCWLRLEPAVSGPAYMVVLEALQPLVESEFTVTYYTNGPRDFGQSQEAYFMKTPCPAVYARYHLDYTFRGKIYIMSITANPSALIIKVKSRNTEILQAIIEDMIRNTGLPFRNRDVSFIRPRSLCVATGYVESLPAGLSGLTGAHKAKEA